MTARALGPPGKRGRGPRQDPSPNAHQDVTTTYAPSIARLDDVRPRALAAWRAACHHLASRRLPPIVPPHVERALRQRGWWLR